MIVTNLLGKYVRVTLSPENIITAEVVAAYGEGRSIEFVVADTKTGKMYCVGVGAMAIDAKREYEVVVYLEDAKKINTIRMVREINGLGLKDAKDFVEKASSTLVIKNNLTLLEAQELLRRLEMNKLECDMRETK